MSIGTEIDGSEMPPEKSTYTLGYTLLGTDTFLLKEIIAMVFRIFADVLLVFHLLFVLFVLFGGVFVFYRRIMVLLHLPAVCWAIFIELSGTICPLTPFENHLRKMAGEVGYTSGFVDHFLMPILYPAGLTEEIQTLLAAVVLAVNFFAYFFVVRKYCRQRGDRHPEK